MEENHTRPDAFDWTYDRYIKDDPEREASFNLELQKAEVAKEIYDLRNQAHLTQERLADIAGVEPRVIEDLEEADYSGDFFAIASQVIFQLKRKLAYLLYRRSWGKKSDKDISKMLGVDSNEIREWRDQDKWEDAYSKDKYLY